MTAHLAAAVVLASLAGPAAFAQPTAQPATRPATMPVDDAAATRPAALPYAIERFERDGPVRGVVVKLDLADPRVRVVVKLTDARDPDGDGPAIGRLDTVLRAAERQELELAMNASFFAVTGSRTVLGKKVGYFAGNGAYPVGWLMADGRVTAPTKPGLRSCLVVHADGRVTIERGIDALPASARYAVSGNGQVLTAGAVTPPADDAALHPRSAVGVSADGRTLVLLAVDGRRAGHSRGVTMGGVGELLRDFGAHDGLNLDGGGSTTLVVKDPVTGVYAIANLPSGASAFGPPNDSIQRPVVDLVGVEIDGQ